MTPYKQLYRHNPEIGQIGDCYRTTIGCLLDIPPEDVPHFYEQWDNNGPELAGAWLGAQGLALAEFPFTGDTLDDVLGTVGDWNPSLYWILTGKSSNNVNHSVVCKGGVIEHDPSLDDSGIVGPTEEGYYVIGVLAKL